uniref:DUF2150 family protein n=1 Tax=Geoglobus ahangari TaxID=113653 RepID=A0A7C3UBL8_9EURY
MFYTEERLNNWIERIKEVNDPRENLEIFDKMLEDFIIAGIKLLESIKSKEVTKKEAIEQIKRMNEIINKRFNLEDDVKNELFEITRDSMRVVLKGLEFAVNDKISKKSFEKLFQEAVKKEKDNDISGAFENLAKMAAKVLKGEKLPENFEIPDEDLLVIGWFDAVDAINTMQILREIDRGDED